MGMERTAAEDGMHLVKTRLEAGGVVGKASAIALSRCQAPS